MSDSSESSGEPGDGVTETGDDAPTADVSRRVTETTTGEAVSSRSARSSEADQSERLTEVGCGVDAELLPPGYDRLVPVEKLVHGENNPREAEPSEALRRSVATEGIAEPLIVWRVEETGDAGEGPVYQITDGWQRYQAAVEAGWGKLPVRVFEGPLAAMDQTATRSEVDEFSPYHWARLCRSIAEHLETGSKSEQVDQIAEMVNRTPQTVRKYLAVMSLPEILHPLVRDGPAGEDSDWAGLSNYNEAIRRYDGLTWETAHYLARHAEELDHTRLLGVAATAVRFERPEGAKEYIRRAVEQPEVPLETVRKEVEFGSQHRRKLEIPPTRIKLDPEAKRALMEHCRRQHQTLSEIVENHVRQVAKEAVED